MSEWISVKDRLPEYDHDCIVANINEGSVYVGCYVEDRWKYKGEKHENPWRNVTHWMPFPSLPNQFDCLCGIEIDDEEDEE